MKPSPAVEQLDDDLYRLGSRYVPVYLLKTAVDRWALIEGGISADADSVWTQLQRLVRSPADVTDWLLTHKHYDHCGLLPLLLPRLPRVRCGVPARMRASLANGKACQVIAGLNARLFPSTSAAPAAADWQGLSLAEIHPGDCLQLSETHRLTVLDAGGHSDDLVTYYDADRERLFASDALGEFDPVDGLWRPLAFHDYGAYLGTLDRLRALAVREVLGGHYRVVGAAARQAAALALEGCRHLERELHEAESCGQGGDILARALHLRWRDQSAPFLPEDLHLASMQRLAQQVQQHLAHTSREEHVH